MHYDFSGYSKERFIDEIDYGFKDIQWINEIKELTVFALRSNTGNGSVVLVMFVNKENVNLVIFTNEALRGNYNYRKNYNHEKEKFEIWLETLKI